MFMDLITEVSPVSEQVLGGVGGVMKVIHSSSGLDTRRCGCSPALPIWRRRRYVGILIAEMS